MAATDVASEPRFQIRATADSHFAWVRTRLALERTANRPLAGDGGEAPHRTPVLAITIGMIIVGVGAFGTVVVRAL